MTLFPLLGSLLLAASHAPQAPDKIGIFDVKAIHAAPLNAQVVGTSETDGVVTEKIRFDAGPGVRAFAQMSYPKGVKGAPATLYVANFGSASHRAETKGGFVTFSICAPEANTDPNVEKTLGGPKNEDVLNFKDNPNDSWIYHHVVALTRGLDYLQSRPEVDMKHLLVMGTSWSGYVANLLHAIDNRPCAYVTWNGTGYYADKDGNSGDKKAVLTREKWQMYAPSAYAEYGTQPVFIANALTDYFARLDGSIEMYEKLKSPKLFVFAPNRYHADTQRNEYGSSAGFLLHYQIGQPAPATVNEGVFEARGGKLLYKYFVNSPETPTRTEVYYSYGPAGHWTGRTWHRTTATLRGNDGYVAEIPVYDPAVPVYAVAQIETKSFKFVANKPQLFLPSLGGVTAANSVYDPTLMDFEDKDDLYVATGQPSFVEDAPTGEGKISASIQPSPDGTIHLMNIEPFLWKDATGQPYKTLDFWIKGDGKAGEAVTLYLGRDSGYYLSDALKDASAIPLVKKGETFDGSWQKMSIPLSAIRDLNRVDALWFEIPGRELKIDGIRLK